MNNTTIFFLQTIRTKVMLSSNKVIEIFYIADDFCIFFYETIKKQSIDDGKNIGTSQVVAQ